MISVGTVGHPISCAPACKYQYKARHKDRGCKDGAACDHCHLCDWKPLPRHWKKRGGKAQPKADASEESSPTSPKNGADTPVSPMSPKTPTSLNSVMWEC